MKLADPSVAAVVERLHTDGYVVVPDRIRSDRLEEIRESVAAVVESADRGSNSFVGYHTRRAYCLLAKTRVLDDVALDPVVMGAAKEVLGPLQLGASVAISLLPGETAQTLHTDQSIYPVEPTKPVIVNTMWAIDRFSAANGATRVVPGSHRDQAGGASTDQSSVPVVSAEMEAGSVLIYLGNLRHGGGANTTTRARLGVVVEYVAGWLRPQENLGLCYPPGAVEAMSPELQELLGYNLYPPFLGYVDGRHPREWLSVRAAARGQEGDD